jgi:pimeloyl-ACP methyl ester carboxylesterase
MAEAVSCLEDVLNDEGPFDGIFGFSQGAALTLTYFYRQQAALQPPLVRFAILFSTAMPCSTDASLGDDIISRLRDLEYDITNRLPCPTKHASLTATEQEFVSVLQRTIVDAADNESLLPCIDMGVYQDGERDAIPRVMYADLLAQKIQIPTVHVWGSNDVGFMVRMAEIAHGICNEDTTKLLKHGGGHDIPKKPTEIRAILRALEWAMARG